MAPGHSADHLATDGALDHSENGPIAKDDLIGLYTPVGWPNYIRNPDLLHHAIKGSLWKPSVWDDHELVSLVRVVGDGTSIAYVQDILVRPDRQRNSTGTRLAAAAPKCFAHVPQTILIINDEPKIVSLYRSVGMTDLGGFGIRGFARFPF